MTEEYIKKIKETYPKGEKIHKYAEALFESYQKGEAYVLANKSPVSVKEPLKRSELSEEHLKTGVENIKNLAILKLNGGLGTTMGCVGAKSAIKLKKGITFLDIIMDHVETLRKTYSCKVPLVLMNSEATEAQTKEILKGKEDVYYFNQHLFPRLKKEGLTLFKSKKDPKQEWYPPGHGELYVSLYTSGILEVLIEKGIKVVFISNSDNLKATVDPSILGLFLNKKYDFLMEVTKKTKEDIKGGSVVSIEDKIELIERSQIPKEKTSFFEDISIFKYFNTNSVWVSLEVLKEKIEKDQLRLSVIENIKETEGETMIQLESALGSAISSFESAGILEVERDRFEPIKTNEDLERLKKTFTERV